MSDLSEEIILIIILIRERLKGSDVNQTFSLKEKCHLKLRLQAPLSILEITPTVPLSILEITPTVPLSILEITPTVPLSILEM